MTGSSRSVHVAWCRCQGLDPEAIPEDTSQRMRRYAFLSGFVARDDAEEAEAQALALEFAEVTGWPLLERETREQRRKRREDEAEMSMPHPCCDNEQRSFAGGCTNCGDPSY